MSDKAAGKRKDTEVETNKEADSPSLREAPLHYGVGNGEHLAT